MSLPSGTKLGVYEIATLLGKGGMGEVYRARDTKLGRDVAIKTLPEEFALDHERVARFEREAKLLASLNHPNIATIHGFEESDGVKALVLELVEGPTLSERIHQGPIPVGQAIVIARQIAEALEAGHEIGVIHRDLKPANIKLKEDGMVKVLDYGLAKALEGGAHSDSNADLSQLPTLTRDGTRVGQVVGTPAYMSPEQARAEKVDRRTDIWAFGAVVYEMLTGKKAFPGTGVSEALAAVIKSEPKWDALPEKLPPRINLMIRRCLNKDAKQRLQHIGDARIEIAGDSAAAFEPIPSADKWKRMAIVAVVFGLVSLIVAIQTLMTSNVARPVTRAVVPLVPGQLLDFGESQFALSPDGRQIAYVGRGAESSKIFLRSLEGLDAKPVDGTDGAESAFFSPDGRWLGFRVGERLMKIPLSGGASKKVADVSSFLFGASWGPDERIVYTSNNSVGLLRISAEGGDPEALTIPDRSRGEKGHRYAEVLPGGEAVLFTVFPGDLESFDAAPIAVLSLRTGEYEVIIEGGSYARYCASGHIVYARSGSLLAVPFDLDRLQVTGTPVTVLDGVTTSSLFGWAQFSLSKDGSLLYAPGDNWGDNRRIVFVDRGGRSEPLIDEHRGYYDLAVSPDGRELALSIDSANISLWVYDIPRKTMSRLLAGFDNNAPVWAPEGDRVAFVAVRGAMPFPNLFVQATDGNGDAKQLAPSEFKQGTGSWSPDGKLFAFDEIRPDTKRDVLLVSVEGGEGPRIFLETEFDERHPNFSPDGKWIAYTSDVSGRDEIYIRPLHGPGMRWPVSTEGGTLPKWSADGAELFYRQGDQMMAVRVETGPELRLGNPKTLFEKPSYDGRYDVTPDGRGFVMIEEQEAPLASQLVLVQNWAEELKRLVPTN